MVRTMNRVLADHTIVRRSPRIVEIVGPAGAGKTTLLRALSQRSESILVVAHPHVRRIGHLPFFVRNTISLLPILLRLHLTGTQFTRLEIVWLARLKGWHRVLARQASRSGRIIVLDQGPVFKLSWLSDFGPEGLKCQSSKNWWDNMVKQWAAVLDVVIRLDAADTVLMERINARGKPHAVKGKAEEETHRFLARGRTSIEAVISRLTIDGGPRVLRFDTGQEAPDEIVEKVLAAFGLEPSEEQWSV
jgi:deoxyadenosine/deoxycytidine kinase